MRLSILPAAALLALATACSGKLSKSTAEKLIKPDYPAVAPIRVPKVATVEKNSRQFTTLQTIHAALLKVGFVDIQTREDGNRVTYTYALTSRAPASTRTMPNAYHIPAAEVQFVRVVAVDGDALKARVPFEVILAQPTSLFPLFEILHPGAKIGQVKTRVADFDKQDGRWGLLKTDESFSLKE